MQKITLSAIAIALSTTFAFAAEPMAKEQGSMGNAMGDAMSMQSMAPKGNADQMMGDKAPAGSMQADDKMMHDDKMMKSDDKASK